MEYDDNILETKSVYILYIYDCTYSLYLKSLFVLKQKWKKSDPKKQNKVFKK